MSLHSYIDNNTFLHIPPARSCCVGSSIAPTATIIFFITGNPGLIAYYHDFLSLLTAQQSDTEIDLSQSVIAGFSLAGFEVNDIHVGSQSDQRTGEPDLLTQVPFAHKSTNGTPKISSLQEQVQITLERLSVLVDTVVECVPILSAREPPKVVLMGHSVGAYIALEIVRLLHQSYRENPEVETVTTSLRRGNGTNINPGPHFQVKTPFTIQSCILLTPTILDIASSPSGRILTPLLTYIPGLSGLAHSVVYILTNILSRTWLSRLVAKIANMPNPSAALDTTVNFLLSSNGVRQALSMSHDEMKEIGPNRWGQEIWGVLSEGFPRRPNQSTDHFKLSKHYKPKPRTASKSSESGTGRDTALEPIDPETANIRTEQHTPRLYFLFAHRDHWVANTSREQIISFLHKSKDTPTPNVVVEEAGNLVHGWCISQNVQVANRVRGWLHNILAS